MWIWILVGLAILVIFFYRSRENMTDGKLMDTLDAFKRDGKKSTEPKLDPIYGPSANPPTFPSSTNSGGRDGKSTAGPYPQIFGPDTTPQPGTGRDGESPGYVNPVGPGQVASDQGKTAEPEFNPDLKNAFPYDGPPQPFLTDFSKILH